MEIHLYNTSVCVSDSSWLDSPKTGWNAEKEVRSIPQNGDRLEEIGALNNGAERTKCIPSQMGLKQLIDCVRQTFHDFVKNLQGRCIRRESARFPDWIYLRPNQNGFNSEIYDFIDISLLVLNRIDEKRFLKAIFL